METINVGQLQSELITAMRGRLSQSRLNQKLQFRSNRIHRWETGDVSLSWRLFCRLCEHTHTPLGEACARALQFPHPPESSAAFVKHMLGSASQTAMASRLRVSRSMISRWRSGKSEPSFQQILLMIHASFFSLAEFLAALVPPERLPSIAAELDRERKEKELHRKHPWIAALLLYLRTVEYNELGRHQEGFLAQKLGISLETERAVMKELLELGVIEREGQIFTPRARSLNTGGDREAVRKINEYWSALCLQFIRREMATPPENNWGYMLFNVNAETKHKIRERYLAFFQDVHNLVQQNKPGSEEVYLMSVQMLNLKHLLGRT